ncbi:hypothetical protein cyc_05464 [Cyclospora cayetanensis]|nr:hypothetical protein cyc_05464 [Cyclospora cayetanensis]
MLAQLVQTLVREEAMNIQHQSDMWLIEETKKAVDLLHNNPSAFPASGYSLREGSRGELYVRVRGKRRHLLALPSVHAFVTQKEFPFWMMDAEAALQLLVADVMNDVMGTTLPQAPPQPIDPDAGELPIKFGYDMNDRRTVKLSFGDSTVAIKCGKTLHTGGAVGVSHGSYMVTIGGSANSTESTIATGQAVVHSSITPDTVQHEVTVGTMHAMQTQISQTNGPGTINAIIRDAKLKVETHPEGKRHGAEFKYKDFVLGVTRDFDDRVNILEHKGDGYQWRLETDLADDQNHAFSGKIKGNTILTGDMVFGAGYDAENQPTAELAMSARDIGVRLNGSNGHNSYRVQIGPFTFDVILSQGLPEFILREVSA